MAKALGPEAFASGDLSDRIEGKGPGVKGGGESARDPRQAQQTNAKSDLLGCNR